MFVNKKATTVLTASVLLTLAAAGPAFSSDAVRAQAKANFQSADVNDDQLLDFNEFKTFIDLNAKHGLGRAPMIRNFGAYGTAFGTADANKDGLVSGQEVRNASNQ